MSIEVRKRQGESANGLLYRFTRKMKQSGIFLEVRKRRFKSRAVNRTTRRTSAIYKARKKTEMDRARKLGIL